MGMDISGRAALVTGASSGFGEAVALGLARAGVKVALAARREDRLQALARRITEAGGQAKVIVADFTDEAQAQRAVREAEAAFGQLDILINNAGVMYLEPVASADLARWRSMIELNLLGLIAATQAALPGMTARQDGHVVNIASTAAHVSNPLAAAYSATKFGVLGFSESLRKEVHKSNIRVTVISPGMAATELRDHIAVDAIQATINEAAAAMRQLTAEDVADAILYAVTRPAHVTINEILMRSTDQER
ncbi:SDR family NAD(P)-dependent oxidoreductase [Caulobacter sp. BE254]|uniref:SDR family oxidoreductase n=1 Tax=Caulobacter sp. BE254 TaxID=2817720 RepID=UPI0028668C86|nr:SDR family NAD(P)-dependent oxidoreductase [Caulobacter sp. BE254]MDR7117201.1 NADP-dependent 3-hydroxy acid dehydrogenase YdfG [Caulobacter sp. BE254]